MTQFSKKSFSVNMGSSDAYRDNWERTFGRAAPELEHAAEQATTEPVMSIRNGPNEGNWAVFAEKVVAERDAALADRAYLRSVLEQVRSAMDASNQSPDGMPDPRRPLASVVWAALNKVAK